MTNREASSLCTTQENTSHLSSSDLIQEKPPLSCSNLSPSSSSNLPHLSSSDLIGGSIKDGSYINNEVNINMVDTRVCALLCPRMTSGRMDTRVKPEHDKKKISSLYQKEENTPHISSSGWIQGNASHLSSSDLIRRSIKDEVGIPSNNLLQQKEYNSNNLPKKKGYNMKQTNLSQSSRRWSKCWVF